VIARDLRRTHTELVHGGGQFVPVSAAELTRWKALYLVEGEEREQAAREHARAAERARTRRSRRGR
jgi:hypothetical protein